MVTVIFADLVGFTARAEQLDPEDVRAMLTSYYTPVREAIESFGGTVEKFIGDAVMGVFGAPVAHGDDPERAVRAALGIRHRISRVNVSDSDRGLEVRIGVNTGEALVALDARPGEGEAMVAGDVVNTAARLQTAASANAILVGEETFRCTRSTIDYEPVEPLIVKGKELPVAAWRVRSAAGPAGERATPDVAMVGRENELATLTRVWQRVLADRQPHLVTILGLPGVGKSRLGAEFVAAAHDAGARVVRGRSLPYGKGSAYDAFAQQVRNVAGVLGGDPPQVVVEKLRRTTEGLIEDDSAEEVVTHIALIIGLQTDGPTVAEAVSGRHVLFASARKFVEALASRQPTVLVFEDLHWADPSLLELIEHLSAQVGQVPLLLLAAARVRLPELLESLEARDLIRREPMSRFPGQQQFRIKHALIRDVAYAALPRAKRRNAHAAVAVFLEEHGGHDSPAAVGHHWLEAGDRERAAVYLVEAADRASRGWAKDEAVALYRQALTLVGEDDPKRRRELRLKLAVAQQMLYHVTDAQAGARHRRESSAGL